MPESASPMQPGATIIEIRPFRGGWQCFEAPGVGPYWTGESAKDDAIGYAQARAKFGRGEIRILAVAGEVEQVIARSWNASTARRTTFQATNTDGLLFSRFPRFPRCST